MEERPKIPASNYVPGAIIYWICIAGGLLCMIGPMVSIISIENNVAEPFKVFDMVWNGQSADQVWAEVVPDGKYPGTLFWMKHPFTGDGIAQLGVWLGCLCALPACLVGAFIFFKDGPRIYTLFGLWTALLLSCAALGII
ncbi:MAG: hypothetical protein U9Q84_06170 [Thermodesulfobacteriota bacterium]|nr:hypothetical protein [Thermodesulfobacteriota bacterium]